MTAMSNQDKLLNWWWSLNGPRDEGPLSIRGIATLLGKARHANVVRGRQGKTISKAGWNYAVLKFLIENCTISPEVKQKLLIFANPQTGNYARWQDFGDCSAEITRTSAAVHMTRSSAQAQVHGPSVVSPDEKLPKVHDQGSLPGLIADLQSAIADGGMDYEELKQAVTGLSALGYQYDHDLFPDLYNTENYTDSIGESPSNLAEALLWKLGKWKSYKRFAAYYMDTCLTPSQTDVVFYAFARHLKDRNNPIYDQHAIRALWAICGNLSDAEKSSCRSLLFDRHDGWKQVGSGSVTIECYAIYVRHVRTLMIGSYGPSLTELDRLLMPLGQAIKRTTSTYADFQRLCGWPING
jgi:hypothetical protein